MTRASDTAEYWEDRGRKHFTYRGERFYTFSPIGLYYRRRQWLLERLTGLLGELATARPTAAKVLDFGCGDGFYSLHFQRLFGGMRFCGCDISRSMIDVARRSAVEAHLPCRFEHTGGPIPFEELFDAILVLAVLAHVPDGPVLESVAADLAGHLAPAGRLVVFEMTARRPSGGATWHVRRPEFYVELFARHGLRCVSSRTAAFPFFHYVGRFVSRAATMLLYRGDMIRANGSRFYQRLTERLVDAGRCFDRILPRGRCNTLFVFAPPRESGPKGRPAAGLSAAAPAQQYERRPERGQDDGHAETGQ